MDTLPFHEDLRMTARCHNWYRRPRDIYYTFRLRSL